MPLTMAEISKLKQLSTANFRQHICQSCEVEFYSVRDSAKFCSSSCRQMHHRKKMLNDENDIAEIEAEIEAVIPKENENNEPPKKITIPFNKDVIDELDEKINKLKAI